MTDDYFDARTLRPPSDGESGCPVAGCATEVNDENKVEFRNRPIDYCPVHDLRIHGSSHTFAYYNGADAESQRTAALRNIVFEPETFGSCFLGNAAKAETHRICHENSEDALTWNVFARLARAGALGEVVATFTDMSVDVEPELILWGLKVSLDDRSVPPMFPALTEAREIYEKGIKKFLTEPDIILYVPGKVLVLVEAKFTSGNTLALTDARKDIGGEKPKSQEGIKQRYSAASLPHGAMLDSVPAGPFYSQLYRNLVFAIHMAAQLDVPWRLVNLVSEEQIRRHGRTDAYGDPTSFIQGILPEATRDCFRVATWEQLYTEHVAGKSELQDLAAYMVNKSASRAKAFAV